MLTDDEICVYWSDEFVQSAVTPVLMHPLGEKALSQMDLPDFKEFPGSTIQRCPGFIGYYRNTFVVRSPVDLKIIHQGEGSYRWETSISDQEAIDDIVQVRDASGMMTLGFFLSIWSEAPLMIEQLHPAFLPGEVAHKCETICGTFDASKWFRPLQPAFRFRLREAEETVSIQRGDPLYLLRLVTDKKVQLQKFAGTPALHDLSNQINLVKSSTYDFHKSMLNYYKAFKLRRLHERVKKEILASLIPG